MILQFPSAQERRRPPEEKRLFLAKPVVHLDEARAALKACRAELRAVERRATALSTLCRAFAGAAIALMCSLIPGHAWAQTNLEKAAHLLEQQSRNGKGEFITFLTGAATAYRWASTDADAGMYCPPPKLTLDGRSYAKIALEEYRRAKPEYAKLKDYPLDVLTLALLRGLREKFPCKSVVPEVGDGSPESLVERNFRLPGELAHGE
jgi:hypothetical protein